MTEENNNKGMQQAKGGVLAQSDIELLRKSLEFYIKNFEILSLNDFLKAIIKDKTILEFKDKLLSE